MNNPICFSSNLSFFMQIETFIRLFTIDPTLLRWFAKIGRKLYKNYMSLWCVVFPNINFLWLVNCYKLFLKYRTSQFHLVSLSRNKILKTWKILCCYFATTTYFLQCVDILFKKYIFKKTGFSTAIYVETQSLILN